MWGLWIFNISRLGAKSASDQGAMAPKTKNFLRNMLVVIYPLHFMQLVIININKKWHFWDKFRKIY